MPNVAGIPRSSQTLPFEVRVLISDGSGKRKMKSRKRAAHLLDPQRRLVVQAIGENDDLSFLQWIDSKSSVCLTSSLSAGKRIDKRLGYVQIKTRGLLVR
jgi:hypothetical protein